MGEWKQSYLRWGSRTFPLVKTRHNLVCFDVTSPVDIDCARSSFCLAPFCGHQCSVPSRVLKFHRYFNINILNTLICITFIIMHLWNNLTGFYMIRVWFSNRRVTVIWYFCSLLFCLIVYFIVLVKQKDTFIR